MTCRRSAGVTAAIRISAIVYAIVMAAWPLLGIAAGKPHIAVVYPDIREPYRSIFMQIIEGIRSEPHTRINTYLLQNNNNVHRLQRQLRKHHDKAVIALGTQALESVKSASELPIVVGAVLMQPAQRTDNVSGITMLPEPSLLFSTLKEMRPSAIRIAVVYNPDINEQLITLASKSAYDHGLELLTHAATDLASAARIYRTLLTSGEIDALWLPQDSTTVDSKIILPLVLEHAWKHNITVFSNNLAHVERGALFALYPDNIAMGRRLARLSLSRLEDDAAHPPHIATLVDLNIAVNTRTATHLGLNFGAEQKQSFHLVFPAP